MRVHELKTWPQFFEAVARGEKTFEARKDDRNFAVGDALILREWSEGHFTGKNIVRVITYKLSDPDFGVQPGWCVLALGKQLEVVDGSGNPFASRYDAMD